MTNPIVSFRRLAASLVSPRGLVRNLFAMLLWQGANYIAPLLTFPHLARTLQPAGFGQYGIYILVAGWLTIVSDWGTNYSGPHLIAQANKCSDDMDETFWNLFFLRLTITFGILAGLFIYIVIMQSSRNETLLLLSAWSIVLGNGLTVSWCLQGLERLDAFATASLAGRLFTIPATILLVTQSDQVWLAILILGTGGIIIGLVSIVILYRLQAIKRFSWSWPGLAMHLKKSAPMFMSTASNGIYSSTATAFLGFFHGSQVTGIFVAADRIRLAAQGAVQPLGQTLYPRISRLAVTDRQLAQKTIRIAAVVQGVAVIAGCLLLGGFAPLVIKIFAGPSFSGAVGILRLMCFSIIFYNFNIIFGRLALLPFGKSKAFSQISAYAAATNLLIMPILVFYFASYGAALGITLTELFIMTSYIIFIKLNKIL